jgi:hypothetical protein
MNYKLPGLAMIFAVALAIIPLSASAETAIIVNVDNFDRAQTDFEFAGIVKLTGGINKVHSNREPTPIDKQNVIRMNRDTLYSLGVINISEGATVTLPETGKRYMSLMVINNDGYVNEVFYGGGSYDLTMEKFDTPYVSVVIRTLANPEDKAALNAGTPLLEITLGDRIIVDGKTPAPITSLMNVRTNSTLAITS